MPFGIGPGELIVVLIIALLVIGPGKLPEVGSALGKSIREFRKASSDVEEATRIDTAPIPPAPAPAAPPPAATTPQANASATPVEPNVLHAPSVPPVSDSTTESHS
jgi:sec-independent protein translocase protein TatA